MGQWPKAISFLLMSSGILGLITKTDPFTGISRNPFISTKISYNKDSIGGPLKNILMIFFGFMYFFI